MTCKTNDYVRDACYFETLNEILAPCRQQKQTVNTEIPKVY